MGSKVTLLGTSPVLLLGCAMIGPIQQVENAYGLWKISFLMPSKYTKEISSPLTVFNNCSRLSAYI